MGRSFAIAFAIMIGGLTFTACYPSTEIEQTWTSGSVRNDPPLRRVVTVMFSSNETVRRSTEDQLARDLIAKGVEATPSYAILGEAELKDVAKVRARLLEMGYDGVVSMRVVDRYQEIEYAPSSFYGYWGYNSPYFYGSDFGYGYGYTETVVRMETTVYSLRTNKLVWSALTKTYGDETHDLIDDTSRIISSQMMKRGLAG